MPNTPTYQQGILRFTPPGESSQGFDFTPLWLQVDNPSSYYVSFPQAPSLGSIPPYYTGVIVAWNQTMLTVNVLASPGGSGAPSLPTSNAPITILATNNPNLSASPGTPLPVFQGGKVVWAPGAMVGTGESLTYTPSPNATGIAFMSAGNSGGNLTAIIVTGNTTQYTYIDETNGSSSVAHDPVWFVSPIIGSFEQLVLEYQCYNDSSGDVGWFIELYGNALTIPAPPVSQPTVIVGTTGINPVTGGFYPPVAVMGTAGGSLTGEWNSTIPYTFGNIVYILSGTSPGFYFCVANNTNIAPPNTAYWFPMTLTLVN